MPNQAGEHSPHDAREIQLRSESSHVRTIGVFRVLVCAAVGANVIIPLCKWTDNNIRLGEGEKGEKDLNPVEYSRDRGAPEEKVALDLHVGDLYWEAPGPRMHTPVHDHIILDGAKAVRIQTHEAFSVPANVFGHACSRTSQTASGLVVANIKIDPRFNGCLQITAYNVGTDRLKIQAGEAFCSVFFETIDGEVDGDERYPPLGPAKDYRKVRGFYYRYRLALATVAISIMASVVGGLVANWVYDKSSEPRQVPTVTVPTAPR